jgi:hypothetical protein
MAFTYSLNKKNKGFPNEVEHMLIKFGQFEAHLDNPKGEMDLAIYQCYLGNMKLVVQWECEPNNIDLMIGHCGLRKQVKSEIANLECQN